jgi:hypothetical protein
MAGPIRLFLTDIAPIRLAEPAMQPLGSKGASEKNVGNSSLDGVCDGVTPYQKGSRYGVINASEKNAVTAAVRTSRLSRSFGGR